MFVRKNFKTFVSARWLVLSEAGSSFPVGQVWVGSHSQPHPDDEHFLSGFHQQGCSAFGQALSVSPSDEQTTQISGHMLNL